MERLPCWISNKDLSNLQINNRSRSRIDLDIRNARVPPSGKLLRSFMLSFTWRMRSWKSLAPELSSNSGVGELIHNLENRTFKGLKCNFKEPFVQTWQCPIHNGTLSSFIWSSMQLNKILMFIILKTDYFPLWFLYTKVIRAFLLLKHIGTIRNKHF